MNRTVNWIYLIAFLLFFSACDEIIVPDISEDQIAAIAPPDGLVSSQTLIQFWWEEVEDATGYRLEIVRPNFDNRLELILDSTVTTTIFDFNLESGSSYQWRISGVNSAYQSLSETRDLTIVLDSSLTGAQVSLLEPLDQSIQGQTDSIVFKWSLLALADEYRLQVATNDQFVPIDVVLEEQVSQNFYESINELGEGLFYWRVQAVNSLGQSEFSTTQAFEIDLTAPTIQLLSPANTILIDSSDFPISFDWIVDQVVSQQLFITNDSTGAGQLFVNDPNGPPYTWTLSETDPTVETYFWQVSATDNAGNSAFTDWQIIQFPQ